MDRSYRSLFSGCRHIPGRARSDRRPQGSDGCDQDANDPPRSLDELQEAVGSTSKDGYHDHHIAEQTAARNAGDPESLIQSRDNLVRIPILKHIDITSYYATRIEQEDGSMLSPRESLKGKDFETRRQFGLEMLRRYGVLK